MVSGSSQGFELASRLTFAVRQLASAFLIVGLFVPLGGRALAADPAEDELNRQGVEARKRGDDQAALESFRRAYAIHHSPRGAAQMGLAEIALGRWADAATHLEEALATATSDPWVRKNEQVLRESLDRVLDQFGTLQVIGSPSGAEVVVEGRVVGTVPMNQPSRVRVGDCRFEVRAPGYASVTRAVAIESSVPRRETVELSSVSPSVALQATALRPIEPQTKMPPPEEADTASRSGHSNLRTAGVIMGAGGLVAIATGVGFGVAARSAGKNNSQLGNTFDPNADDSGKTYQTLQYVGLGLGAALLLAGTVTFLLGGDSDHGSANAQVAILPQAGGVLTALSGTF